MKVVTGHGISSHNIAKHPEMSWWNSVDLQNRCKAIIVFGWSDLCFSFQPRLAVSRNAFMLMPHSNGFISFQWKVKCYVTNVWLPLNWIRLSLQMQISPLIRLKSFRVQSWSTSTNITACGHFLHMSYRNQLKQRNINSILKLGAGLFPG